MDSKANLLSYCQEVIRQLDMEYRAPRLPVDLAYTKKDVNAEAVLPTMDQAELVRGFQSLARNKHNIRVC